MATTVNRPKKATVGLMNNEDVERYLATRMKEMDMKVEMALRARGLNPHPVKPAKPMAPHPVKPVVHHPVKPVARHPVKPVALHPVCKLSHPVKPVARHPVKPAGYRQPANKPVEPDEYMNEDIAKQLRRLVVHRTTNFEDDTATSSSSEDDDDDADSDEESDEETYERKLSFGCRNDPEQVPKWCV